MLLAEPLDPGRPRHLAPTRALGDSVSYDGKLTLRDASVSIQISDTDYADVTIELKLDAQSEAPPVVLLGSAPLGGAACPWPTGKGRGGDFDRNTIVRRGRRALLSFRGESAAPCAVAPGRLTLALTGGNGTAIVRELQIRRSAE